MEWPPIKLSSTPSSYINENSTQLMDLPVLSRIYIFKIVQNLNSVNEDLAISIINKKKILSNIYNNR